MFPEQRNVILLSKSGIDKTHLATVLEIGACARRDLLILDELGYVPFSEEGAELLFQILLERYERVW